MKMLHSWHSFSKSGSLTWGHLKIVISESPTRLTTTLHKGYVVTHNRHITTKILFNHQMLFTC